MISKLEETLALHIRAVNLPTPTREHRFHEIRRWRFDFAWPEQKIAAECEGLTRPGKKSRHTTNAGFVGDLEKYNAAAMLGWRVLRFDASMIKSGYAVDQLRVALREKDGPGRPQKN